MTRKKFLQISVGVTLGIIAGLVLHQAFADEGQIVQVEPNNGPPYYQVHYLKIGEQPSYYNFKCWGCNFHDYINIYKETGLWNWNMGSPSDWLNYIS